MKLLRPAGKGYYNLSDQKGKQIILSNLVRIRKQFGILWFLIMLIYLHFNHSCFLWRDCHFTGFTQIQKSIHIQ